MIDPWDNIRRAVAGLLALWAGTAAANHAPALLSLQGRTLSVYGLRGNRLIQIRRYNLPLPPRKYATAPSLVFVFKNGLAVYGGGRTALTLFGYNADLGIVSGHANHLEIGAYPFDIDPDIGLLVVQRPNALLWFDISRPEHPRLRGRCSVQWPSAVSAGISEIALVPDLRTLLMGYYTESGDLGKWAYLQADISSRGRVLRFYPPQDTWFEPGSVGAKKILLSGTAGNRLLLFGRQPHFTFAKPIRTIYLPGRSERAQMRPDGNAVVVKAGASEYFVDTATSISRPVSLGYANRCVPDWGNNTVFLFNPTKNGWVNVKEMALPNRARGARLIASGLVRDGFFSLSHT